MVTVEQLRERYAVASTPDLLEARRIAYETLKARGLAAEDLALVFMALGVVDAELQVRSVGRRRDEYPAETSLGFQTPEERARGF